MTNTYPSTPPLQRRYITVEIPDISTGGQRYVVPGFRGKIVKIHSVINGAITNAAATLTTKIESTAVTGGAITIAVSGSGAGVKDSATPTANNTFGVDDAIEVETNGGSTGTVPAVITLVLDAV